MSAGKLQHRVIFDEPQSTRDEAGGEVQSWQARFNVAADFIRLRGNEKVVAARMEGTQPTVIIVRVSADTAQIRSDWRARDARTGEEFNIHVPVKSDDRKYYEIMATSGVAT